MIKRIRFWFLVMLSTLAVLSGSVLQIGEAQASAQTTASTAVLVQRVYADYPELVRSDAAASLEDDWLSHFIDYHLHVKSRPGRYHFDWELSMADYLNAAENSDVSAAAQATLARLDRQQRYRLIAALEQAFTDGRLR